MTKHYLSLFISICLLAVIVVFTVSSIKLSIGELSSPSPGWWPFYVSLIGLGLCGFVIVEELTGKDDVDTAQLSNVNWLKVVSFAISVLTFVILYNYLGFLISSILLLFVLLRFHSTIPMAKSLVISLIVPIVLFIVFVKLLHVPL